MGTAMGLRHCPSMRCGVAGIEERDIAERESSHEVWVGREGPVDEGEEMDDGLGPGAEDPLVAEGPHGALEGCLVPLWDGHSGEAELLACPGEGLPAQDALVCFLDAHALHHRMGSEGMWAHDARHRRLPGGGHGS